MPNYKTLENVSELEEFFAIMEKYKELSASPKFTESTVMISDDDAVYGYLELTIVWLNDSLDYFKDGKLISIVYNRLSDAFIAGIETQINREFTALTQRKQDYSKYKERSTTFHGELLDFLLLKSIHISTEIYETLLIFKKDGLNGYSDAIARKKTSNW